MYDNHKKKHPNTTEICVLTSAYQTKCRK